MVPVSLKFENTGPPSKVRRLLLPLLIEDPQRTEAQCMELLQPQGITEADLLANTTDTFLQIREQAFYERIWREITALKDASPDTQKIKSRMLPHADPLLTKTVLGDLFDEQYDVVMREKAMLRFTLPLRWGDFPLLNASDEKAPILPIGQAAAYSGFVDYLPESVEGTVRSVPLVVRYRDRLIPQMDLVAACAYLGVDIQRIKLSGDAITIPQTSGNDVVIPVTSRDSTVVGPVGMLMEVPMFGRVNDWLTMYDYPRYEKQAHHVSVYQVWQICETEEKLKQNRDFRQHNLINALYVLHRDAEGVKFLDAHSEDEKKRMIRDILDGPNGTGPFIKTLTDSLAAEPDPDSQKLLDSVKTADADLRQVDEQNDKLEAQLSRLRGTLYEKLHERAIFFGGTATGLLDLRPTSLIGECPGIVIHGAIYNAILTGKMWRVASPRWGTIITAAMGLLTLLLVMRLSPLMAFGASAGLLVGYLGI